MNDYHASNKCVITFILLITISYNSKIEQIQQTIMIKSMLDVKCLFSKRHRKLFLNVLVVSLSFCVRRHHRSRPLREENA